MPHGLLGAVVTASTLFLIVYAAGLALQPGEAYLRFQSNIIYNAPALAGLCLALPRIRRVGGRERAGFVALAFALLAWHAGDWTFSYYDYFGRNGMPFPSVADALYYLGYGACMVALPLLVLPARRLREGRWIVDAAILMVVAGAASWEYLLGPIIQQGDQTAFAAAVALGYPLFDVGLLGVLVVSLYASPRPYPRRTLVLAVACAVQIVTDSLYTYTVTVSHYDNIGDPLELGWLAAYLLMAICFVLPAESVDAVDVDHAGERHRVLGLIVPYVVIVPVGIVAIFEAVSGGASPVIVGGVAACVALVLLRQILTLRENLAMYRDLRNEHRARDGWAQAQTDLGEGLLVIDNGRIVNANAAAARMTGYGEDELAGLPSILPLVPEGGRPNVSAWLDRRLSGEGDDVREEVSIVRRDGTPARLELAAKRLDVDGRAYLLVVCRDITDRHRAAVALRRSESTLRATLEATTDGIVVVNHDNRALHVNGRFLEMWGVPRELVDAGDDDAVQRFIAGRFADPAQFTPPAEAMNGEFGESFDVVRLTDGRAFERYSRPLIVDGRAAGRAWGMRDISERIRSEQVLQKSEERFRTLVHAAGSVIIAIAADGSILEFNAAAEAMFGVTRDQAMGHDAIDLLTEEDRRHEFRDVFGDVLAGRDLRGLEIAFTATDGVVRTAHWNVTRWLDAEGAPAGVIAAGVDISERKQTEEMLRATLGELSASKAALDEKSSLLELALAAEREHARHDPLTGALNHGAISEVLAARLADIHPEAPACAIVMVDVDGMKAVNDTYGHQAGDMVLVAVANALMRSGAIVGRYGGDEFIAMLDGTDRLAAQRYCDAVEDELESVVLSDSGTGHHIPANVSLGVAVFPEEAETVADLIRLSDSAMYAYKRERQRPAAGDAAAGGHIEDDRSARMVGELVPLLTAPGALDDKLRLVSHRLSIGAGYAGVSFTLFSPTVGTPIAANSFAPGQDEVAEAWNRHQREDDGPEPHPIRKLLQDTHRPVMIENGANDRRLLPGERRLLTSAGFRRALVVPMIWQDAVVGMLGVASKGAAFDAQDVQFVSAVATQVTAIVRMHRLVTELEAATARLAASHGDTVMMLAAAAEAHDRTTGLHLASIRVLAEALGRELGYNEKEVAGLGMAGVLHDIGKISVPDTVLSSTGRLDGEQWEIMRQHTVWGAQFLGGKPGFRLAAQVARSHHERWDGRGYPDGLEGDAIPEAAQIVTVADSFDAMTHDRPYRARRPVNEALGEIIACSGKQFSPRVVAALVRLFERDELPHDPHATADDAAPGSTDTRDEVAA